MDILATIIVITIVIYFLTKNNDQEKSENRRSLEKHSVEKQNEDSRYHETFIGDINIKPGSEIITKVVGVTFEGRQNVVASLAEGEKLKLISEPNNPHDENAIMVVRVNGQQVGYLNRKLAAEMKYFYKETAFTQWATVIEITGTVHGNYNLGVWIKFFAPTLDEMDASGLFLYPPF